MNIKIFDHGKWHSYYFDNSKELRLKLEIEHNIIIQEGLILENECVIYRNVKIGKNVTIYGDDVLLYSNTQIGDNCKINYGVSLLGNINIKSNVIIDSLSKLEGNITIDSDVKIGRLCRVIGDIIIKESTIIEDSCCIDGKSTLSSSVKIMERSDIINCEIRSNVLVESDCKIDNSILSDYVKIRSGANIRKSFIHKNVIIGKYAYIPENSDISQSMEIVTSEGEIYSWYSLDQISFNGHISDIKWFEKNGTELLTTSNNNLAEISGISSYDELNIYIELTRKIFNLLPKLKEEKLTILKLNDKKLSSLNIREFDYLINYLINKHFVNTEKHSYQFYIKSLTKGLSGREFINACEDIDILLWLYFNIQNIDLKNWLYINARCAEKFVHRIDDIRCTKAIETANKYASNKVSEKELEKAQMFVFKAIEIMETGLIFWMRAAYEADDGEHLDLVELKNCNEQINIVKENLYCALFALRSVSNKFDNYFLKHDVENLTEEMLMIYNDVVRMLKKHIQAENIIINIQEF